VHGHTAVARDSRAEGEAVLAEIAKHHPGMTRPNAFIGNVDEVAAHLKKYWDVGANRVSPPPSPLNAPDNRHMPDCQVDFTAR